MLLTGPLVAVPAASGDRADISGCGSPAPLASNTLPAPLAGVTQVQGADLEALRAAIREIDLAFASNSLDKLRGVLATAAEAPKRGLERELRWLLDKAKVLSQESEIHRAQRIAGVDAVYTTVLTKLRPTSTRDMPWTFDRREDRGWVYFFRPGESGPVLARIESWNERNRAWIASDAITCAACPWRIPRPTGWFVVPREAGACAAFDSVSFVHGTLELSVDFDCYAGPCQESPAVSAQRDQELLNQAFGVKDPVVCLERREFDSHGIRRADLTFETVRSGRARGPSRILRSYRRAEPFLFTFVARGEAAAFERARADVNRVVDSLEIERIEGPGCDRIERIAHAHMSPGRVEGEHVRDEGLGLSVKAPYGWIGMPQPGVGRFCVRFTPPVQGDSPRPVSPGERSWTIFAWEDEVSPYGEAEVVRFFEGRRGSMLASQYENWQVRRRESSAHSNGIDLVFEVESTWRHRGEPSLDESVEMREVFAAVPCGRFLLCVVARAPSAEFESYRAAFDGALSSLRRGGAR